MPEPANPSQALADLISEEWEARLKANPFLATHTGDLRYNDRLPDASEAGHANCWRSCAACSTAWEQSTRQLCPSPSA